MKKIISIFFLLSISTNLAYSQSGWFWQNPYPIGYNLYSIFDAGNNVLYSSGFNGAVLKSTNSGLNWEIKYTGTLEDFLSCYFINENIGYLVGTKILKTTNGGNNWEIQFGEYNFFNSCAFYNSIIGMAVGRNGIIYRTIDGGKEWVPVNNTSIGLNLIKVNCIDSSTFIVASDRDKVLRTTNLGNNWDSTSLDADYKILTMDIISPNIGLIISQKHHFIYPRERYWKTTNSGINWILISEVQGNTDKKNLQLVNENTGYLHDSRAFYRTTNGGIGWDRFITGTAVDLYGLNFSNTSTGYLVGYNGEMEKSTNGGLNWNILSHNATDRRLWQIFFLNNNLGYTVGIDGTVLATVNGGINWIKLNFPVSINLRCLYFINGSTGFVAGNSNGNIYKTTNGGISWQTKSSEANSVSGIYFVDQNIGFACGYPGIILKTTNGGDNWTTKFSGGNISLLDIMFTSFNTGYVGAGGSVLKTTNSGENWIQLGQGLGYFGSIDFVSDDTGYVCNSNGEIYKTYNGGLNWILKDTRVSNLFSIDFLNSYTGYAVGQKIIKTTNGGDNWVTLNLFDDTFYSLWSVQFLDSNIGYATGDLGAILKTTDGGGSIINVTSNSTQIPSNISLQQNYPNPFNPITKIKFEISQSRDVKLIIFDIMGKEIKTLINEQLHPGTYEEEWDGTNYPSGIYFYRIATSDFIETKKMVLTK